MRTLLLLVRLLVLAASIAGCSGDRDRSEMTDGSTPSIDDILARSYQETWAPWRGDLDGMIDRRLIRVVTPFGGYLFHYDDGEPKGATWELANHFEDYLNKDLGLGNLKVIVVVIPLSRDQLIPALLDGHADIIAADLTRTETRARKIAFTRPLLTDINEVIITGPAADEIETLDDIAGMDIHVRRSSSYFEHLQRLSKTMRQRDLRPPSIVPVDEVLESEDILDLVNAGMIGMTVLDDYKAEFWATAFPEIEVREDLIVHRGGSISWAVRKTSKQLLKKLNSFLRQYGRGTLVGNDTYNRYLDDARDLRCSKAITSNGRLADLADTFRKYGDRYGIDWLRLAAQAFQESRFSQDRRSSAGAVGVMQIRPSTAADPNVGIDDISTIDGNVHAGTKYMHFLANRYFSDATVTDLNRWLLSLAAYNAGPARVISLRDEAARRGYDPNTWFDNVEVIAAKRIGRETVTYVGNVFKYYTAYRMATAKLDVTRRRHSALLDDCN